MNTGPFNQQRISAEVLPPPGAAICVEVTRGDCVESWHSVLASIVGPSGRRIADWGDGERQIMPRSSAKPLQALPLVLSGAADAFRVDEEEHALAAASHNGEACHVAKVEAWLARLDLSVADLECGGHDPIDADSTVAMHREARTCHSAHNNCSGQHAGFLTVARHLGVATKGYIGRDHAVQQMVISAAGGMMDLDLGAAPWGVDGCGIPTLAMPLWRLALGFARLGESANVADDGDDELARAAGRIYRAMSAKSYYVAGRGRLDTSLMSAANGKFILKSGAEGVVAAAVAGQGLGIALKVLDGNKRAAEVVATALLAYCGALDDVDGLDVESLLAPPISNIAGEIIGEIRVGGVSGDRGVAE